MDLDFILCLHGRVWILWCWIRFYESLGNLHLSFASGLSLKTLKISSDSDKATNHETPWPRIYQHMHFAFQYLLFLKFYRPDSHRSQIMYIRDSKSLKLLRDLSNTARVVCDWFQVSLRSSHCFCVFAVQIFFLFWFGILKWMLLRKIDLITQKLWDWHGNEQGLYIAWWLVVHVLSQILISSNARIDKTRQLWEKKWL